MMDWLVRGFVAGARVAGILVIEALGGVVAIREEAVPHGDAAEADQAEFAIVGDRGCEKHEAIHAAAIDGQLEDWLLAHSGGDAALGIFDHRRFAGAIDSGTAATPRPPHL